MEPRGKVEAKEGKDGREANPNLSNHGPVEMKSPPVQTMDGYDPNRIPSSIFSTSPGDWSGASNESLFSIQMGNNSFSKDYAILYGKSPDFDWDQTQNNPLKSGDLPRLDDWSNRKNRSTKYSSLTPVTEVPSRDERSSVQSSELSRNQSPNAALAKPNPNPRVSDGSGHSNMSFAFPVLVSDSAKTDYSIKVVPEKPVFGPEKVVEKPPVIETIAPPQQQQQQPKSQQQSQSQQKAGAHPLKRWFSCFSCSWPRFC